MQVQLRNSLGKRFVTAVYLAPYICAAAPLVAAAAASAVLLQN
jgi:hypothetical protein